MDRNQLSIINHRSSIAAGFTLLEVLIATILVGLSIVALVAANGSFTVANGAGADLSTAEFLVEQIRELMTLLPVVDSTVTTWTTLGPESGETTVLAYDDVDDFDGAMFSPPINANRATLSAFDAFSQQVTVEKVNSSNFDQVVGDADSSPFVRVTVRVLQNGREITSASWIRARY